MTKKIKSVSVIGDSVFKGVVFDENRNRYVISKESASKLLQKELPLEINNYSRYGITIKEASKLLDYVLTHSFDELIIIEIGGNDSDFDWDAISENPNIQHYSKTPIDKFKKALEKMVKKTISCNRSVVLSTLPNIDSHKYLDWVSKGKEENKENILKWLKDVNKIANYHDEYNKAIYEIANKYDLGIIDIRNHFSDKNLLCIDGIHPSDNGQYKIKEIILKSLKESKKYNI